MSKVTSDTPYLSILSPRDKPWDRHRASASVVQTIYKDTDFARYAERIGLCSQRLEFAIKSAETQGEQRFRLLHTHFCRVRTCPVCQWRRALMWKARALQALPRVLQDYPGHRWLFVTLTAKNCPIQELRETVRGMHKAFERMTKRKDWPGLGYIKSLEVTRNPVTGEAHPHFHVLILVPSTYFGAKYLTQQKWRELWQSALKVDYLPVVNIKAVKPKGDKKSAINPIEAISGAIAETLKYSVKPEDLVADPAWLLELTTQLHNTRAVGVGGILRNYFNADDPEDLINTEESPDTEASDDDLTIWFGWREAIARYVQIENDKDN